MKCNIKSNEHPETCSCARYYARQWPVRSEIKMNFGAKPIGRVTYIRSLLEKHILNSVIMLVWAVMVDNGACAAYKIRPCPDT